MICLEKNKQKIARKILDLRKKPYLWFLLFGLIGSFISYLAILVFGGVLIDFSITNFQSLFQLAVALNAAIGSFDSFAPKDQFNLLGERIFLYRKKLEDMRDDSQELMELIRNLTIEKMNNNSGELIDYMTPEVEKIYLGSEKIFSNSAEFIEKTYKAMDNYYSPIEELINSARGRMAFVAMAISFVILIVCTIFPNAGKSSPSGHAECIQIFLGFLVGISYTPIFLVAYGVLISIRRLERLKTQVFEINLLYTKTYEENLRQRLKNNLNMPK